jgi:hypothetical protein
MSSASRSSRTGTRTARTTSRPTAAGGPGSAPCRSTSDEPGVDAGRGTETYASLTVEVDNPRWTGVPFTLRSGKPLPADSAEIAVHFRPMPQYLLDRWPGIEPNVLRIGLTEPYVRLSAALNGPEQTAEICQLEARTTAPRLTAYAHLILEMLRGDPMVFIRGDEAEEPWRIIDPVMQAWSAGQVRCRTMPPERRRRDWPPDRPPAGNTVRNLGRRPRRDRWRAQPGLACRSHLALPEHASVRSVSDLTAARSSRALKTSAMPEAVGGLELPARRHGTRPGRDPG